LAGFCVKDERNLCCGLKMNIIILEPREPVPSTKGGVIKKLTWGLAKGLAKYGHEVTIISTCENPVSKYTTENINIICISPPIPGSRFYFKEMPLFSYRAGKTIEKLLMNKPINDVSST
jgi:hypothetical protein